MLGRTANDLFWMSRYVERAENMARLLEVTYRIALLPREGEGQSEEWLSTLRSCGGEEAYLAGLLHDLGKTKIPLDILTILAPHFPPPGQVLGQGARINEKRWKDVAARTGDPGSWPTPPPCGAAPGTRRR